MKIYNIKDRPEFIKEIAILEHNEWGSKTNNLEEYNYKINKKIDKIKALLDRNDYCKLILLDNDTLVGFISIFPQDGEDRLDLTPWYATMYVKEEYRGLGYSKILNDAILYEAKNLGYKKIYLKTDLVNYYEKFGAKYIEELSNGEKLYYFDLNY